MDIFKAIYKKFPVEISNEILNSHAIARHLTKDLDVFQLNLIEFDSTKLQNLISRNATIQEMGNTLIDLDKLLLDSLIPADSPASILIASSLHSLYQTNTEKFKADYSNVSKLIESGLKIPAIAAILGRTGASDTSQKVNEKVTIKLDHHERTMYFCINTVSHPPLSEIS